MKENALNGIVHDFSINFSANGTKNILNIYEYLMEKQNI